jgi:copper homeostasis protein (lipoprotein)
MQTIKHLFKQILTLFFCLTLFSGCNLVVAETAGTQDKDAHHAQEDIDWPGIYLGFTPCGDCAGVKTTLALNKNHNYVLMTQFIGKSDREFVEKGKYTWDNSSKIITLTPRKNATIHQYVVSENKLTQLDTDGKPFTGEQAKRYVLHRKDVANAPQEHSGH